MKKRLFSIAFILILTASAFMAGMATTNAHTPTWTIPTYAYLTASPNPVGIGQPVTFVFWLDKYPPTAGGTTGDRWRNENIQITKPDGTKVTLGPFNSDPVGSGYTLWSPDQVGTYTCVFTFPGQALSQTGPSGSLGLYSDFINDTYLASTATTTFTAQQQPIAGEPNFPLPTGYWSRPIEGQNTNWYTIASNWMASPQIVGKFQPDGTAPNTSHIMWTKPLLFGGVVGGSNTGSAGMTFYDGSQYENKFMNPMIICGRLYYSIPFSDASSGGGYACVDLQTGIQYWVQNYTVDPTFGQLYDYESLNQHGVIPNGYLWASSGTTLIAYDALTGRWLFNETNVPTGTAVYGPNGEILRYVLNYPGRWLALWNNTAHYQGLEAAKDDSTSGFQWRPIGKVVDMSNAYTWNVTIPSLSGAGNPSILKVIPGDMVLGSSSAGAGLGGFGTGTYFTLWALSLRTGSMGQLLWIQNYTSPSGNQTLSFGPVDPQTRVFLTWNKEKVQWQGYNLDTGSLLWTGIQENPWNIYSGAGGALMTNTIADGKLFSTGYSGIVYTYDLKTGKVLWNYTAYAGFATPYGNYPLGIAGVADGKLYLISNEHSANAPYWKGCELRCLNETTGQEVWTIWAHGCSSYGSYGYAIADGYLVFYNVYDNQIYCIGLGPSATTVEAPMSSVTAGSSVTIRGTVTDQCAGQTSIGLPAKGTPAISDASMSAWMEYLYQGKPKPTNAIGVLVTLSVLDPNNNTYVIGSATSDMYGSYGISWTPPVPGLYQIIATFAGSGSYGGSTASTYLTAAAAPSPAVISTPAPSTAAPTPPPTLTPTVTPLQTIAPTPSPASPAVQPPTSAMPTATYIAIGAAIVVVVAVAAALILRRHR
ncbi:MAG TPA: PQQ-binding-like beta-propeller repeat protein [Candidatus Nanoarchaeia archaeon]|nr:PQQ-binding-like beta-propeller repeat protein [Candidatus Nanoarchaeia archaeon]